MFAIGESKKVEVRDGKGGVGVKDTDQTKYHSLFWLSLDSIKYSNYNTVEVRENNGNNYISKTTDINNYLL